MDHITATSELDYSPTRAEELGYDREAIAFLGISRLKGVGFQTLSGLDGRAGIADLLDGRDVSEITKRVSHLRPGVGNGSGTSSSSRSRARR